MEQNIYIKLDEEGYSFKFSNNNDKDLKILLSEIEFYKLKDWLKKSDLIHTVKVNENRSIILYKNKIKYAEIIQK